MKKEFTDTLMEQGLSWVWASSTTVIAVFIAAIFLGLLVAWVTKLILRKVFSRLARNTKTHLDDLLINNRVPALLSYLLTLYFIEWLLITLAVQIGHGNNILKALEGLVTLLIIRAIFNAVKTSLKAVIYLKDKPLDSYFQVVLGAVWFLGGIAILSLLTGKSIAAYLTTLGALSAVLLLIFKDTLLGFKNYRNSK